MTHPGKARTALKRGALLAAANWQVVIVQAVSETTFKLLLAVPILGGAFLVTLLLGRDISEMLAGDLREILFGVATTLAEHPLALAAYLVGFLLVLAGGSALVFLVKGGTVSLLVLADRESGPVERPPLRLAGFRAAMMFSIEHFTAGAAVLFPRYLRLGVLLLTGLPVLAAVSALIPLASLGALGAAAALAIPLLLWRRARGLQRDLDAGADWMGAGARDPWGDPDAAPAAPAGGWRTLRIGPRCPSLGRSLGDLDLPGGSGAALVALLREGHLLEPRPDARLQAGDLLVFRRGQRVGFEFKYNDAPDLTKSMHVAMKDLKLNRLFVVYPGGQSLRLASQVELVSIQHLPDRLNEFRARGQ